MEISVEELQSLAAELALENLILRRRLAHLERLMQERDSLGSEKSDAVVDS
jgi:hypothetical protein